MHLGTEQGRARVVPEPAALGQPRQGPALTLPGARWVHRRHLGSELALHRRVFLFKLLYKEGPSMTTKATIPGFPCRTGTQQTRSFRSEANQGKRFAGDNHDIPKIK